MGKCPCCPTSARSTPQTWRLQVHDLSTGSLLWWEQISEKGVAFHDGKIHIAEYDLSETVPTRIDSRVDSSGLGSQVRSFTHDVSSNETLKNFSVGYAHAIKNVSSHVQIEYYDAAGDLDWTYDTAATGAGGFTVGGGQLAVSVSGGVHHIDSTGTLIKVWATGTWKDFLVAPNRTAGKNGSSQLISLVDDVASWTRTDIIPTAFRASANGIRYYGTLGASSVSGRVDFDGVDVWSNSNVNTSYILGMGGDDDENLADDDYTFDVSGTDLRRWTTNGASADWTVAGIVNATSTSVGTFRTTLDGGFIYLGPTGLGRYDTNGAEMWLQADPHWDYGKGGNYGLDTIIVDETPGLLALYGQSQTY